MRWLVLLLIASFAFPSAAQEGAEFEKLIQKSLALESPGDGERDEVEKRFRAIWPKLHNFCVCEPGEIGEVMADTWGKIREAEKDDGFLETVEMFHRTIDGVRRELDSAGAYTPSLQICQQYANLYLAARTGASTMEEASKQLVDLIHGMVGDEH